jgi:hypothetical protein
MVQPKHVLTSHPTENRVRQKQRCDTVPIRPRQSLTRRDYIVMSCSSIILSPLISFANGIEFGVNNNAAISPTAGEFLVSTQLGLERLGRIKNKLTFQPLNSKIDFIFKRNKEPLYYPAFMFGAWNVTAKLLQSTQIYNSDVISMLHTDTTATNEATTDHNFQRQYFTTIANTIQNQITINLGTGIPETKVISNRAYNLPSEFILLKNINTIPVSTDIINIKWDYRSSTVPTRVEWEDVRDQQIRYELETIGYESELVSHKNVFAATEHNRIRVFDESTTRSIIETETTTEYHELSEGIVQAFTRIIIMDNKTPTSMTVLDYDLSMHRMVQSFINRSNNYVANRPCVETPIGIVQCY